jgi:hypothetical protein
MKEKDKRYVQSVVDNEGFDYAFFHYSDFSDIEDDEFHRLRKAYVEAHKNLAKYLDIDF